MPLPSAKSKPQEQKDQKKQKSLLGWLSKPADAKVANSSSAVRNAPVTSSSPSGRESIFETPSTKKGPTDTPAVRSATFTKSSDGGTSFNETPPTSDPIDVDMSSDEDVSGRGIKSVCGTRTYVFSSIGDHDFVSQARTKRKITIEDSDEDEAFDNIAATKGKSSSAYRSFKDPGKMNAHSHHSLFVRLMSMAQGRAKKARVNPSEDDVFLESDDQDDTPSAFSQTLSRFKKSPKRKGRHNGYYLRIYGHISYSLSYSASYQTLR